MGNINLVFRDGFAQPQAQRSSVEELLNAQLSDALEANAELVAENQALKAQVDELQRQKDNFMTVIEAAARDFNRLSGKVEELDNQLEALYDQLDEMQDELEADEGPDEPAQNVDVVGFSEVHPEDRGEIESSIKATIEQLTSMGLDVRQVQIKRVA